jgi:hypothetical protein
VSLVRRLWLSLALAAAVAALATSVGVTVAAAHGGLGSGSGPGMMTGQRGHGTGMMGAVWLPGDGQRVASIDAARHQATVAATSLGLRPGEVIWFDNGFYVELKDTTGDSATEVIVDPATGTVSTEPGPAMMWNTRYGMHRTATGPATVTAEQARQLATAWLAANLSGRLAQPPDAYPGYYTLETTTPGGTINGMLSVNATTGSVWYHAWHGRFIAREDA